MNTISSPPSPSGGKERPILFSAAMVRAILDGRKTQTRRPVKAPRQEDRSLRTSDIGRRVRDNGAVWFNECGWVKPCYFVGDVLWVRETFHAFDDGRVRYRADGVRFSEDCFDGPWTPSIHMRRVFSRITREVTRVRAQRIQSISAEDCIAEGIWEATKDGNVTKWGCDGIPWTQWGTTPQEGFRAAWESVYPGSWDRNDWVWVYTFRGIDA